MRQEGFSALFYGYKATIFRDLPFSALQFAFYEQEQDWARAWVGSKDIGLSLEILTGTSAGGIAGVMTCPLDVVKTRIQTQLNPTETTAPTTVRGSTPRTVSTGFAEPSVSATMSARSQTRHISTSSPNTSVPKAGAPLLDTSSVFTGLRLVYKTEGIAGLFRGVGPRFLWTSVQSGTMLVLYQILVRKLDHYLLPAANEGAPVV